VSVLAIIIVVLAVLIVVLFAGGLIANARHRRVLEARLQREIAAANEALADARAADRGWDLATMEAAAREAFASKHPGAEPTAVHLVQVVDRPGTDQDVAVFRIEGAGREERITLGRRDGRWVTAAAAV
jgi:hypothetical protein